MEIKTKLEKNWGEDVSDEEKEILIDMIQAIGSRMTENYDDLGDLRGEFKRIKKIYFSVRRYRKW